jgi:outer membrane biogenesis lipoprotein LolB
MNTMPHGHRRHLFALNLAFVLTLACASTAISSPNNEQDSMLTQWQQESTDLGNKSGEGLINQQRFYQFRRSVKTKNRSDPGLFW